MTDREQFLLDRKQGLGGSDIAAIMGLSPWRTPLDVYLDKISAYTQEENLTDALKRGIRAEEYVLDTYEEESSNKLVRNNQTIKDQKYNFLFANIDAKLETENIIVEAKTTSDFLTNWECLPEYYKTQVAHYAYITNADRVHIPVLFSNWQYKCFIYERDLEFEKELRAKAVWFWVNHVQKRIPPKATTIEDMAKLYPESNNIMMEADKLTLEAILVLKNLKEDIKQKTETCKQVTKNIQEYMQDSEVLHDEDKQIASWKNQVATRFDTGTFKADHPELYNQYKKESTSRVFRVR